jgi:hypothetical protein
LKGQKKHTIKKNAIQKKKFLIVEYIQSAKKLLEEIKIFISADDKPFEKNIINILIEFG